IAASTAETLAISNSSAVTYFSVGQTASTQLFVRGGTPPYTWTLDSGVLPTGVSIIGPGETLSGTFGPGFMFLSGIYMGPPGTYTFTLRATDSVGGFVTRTFNWIVAGFSNQITFLPISGSTLTAGTPYSQKLLFLGGTATAGTGNYTWTAL